LRAEIRAALLGTEYPDRVLLSWMESQERGDWAACDALAEANGLDPQQLGRSYTAAVLWAEDTLHFAL